MKKFLKPGRVVILLTGRYAGKKAVIVKVLYDGSKDRKFGHVLVAGIERYPRKVHKRMSEERVKRRIRIKPFVKYVNFNHFIPTRYSLSQEIDVKGLLKAYDQNSSIGKDSEQAKTRDPLKNTDFKIELKKKVKNMLEEKYRNADLNGNSQEAMLVKFFFKPLKF